MTRRSFGAALDSSVCRRGDTIQAIRMLIRYSAIIGAANSVWFHGSADGVSTAAAMKISRIASLMAPQKTRSHQPHLGKEQHPVGI